VTQPLDDDVLLAALGTALAPQPVEPGPEAMAALNQALDAWRPDATEDGSAVVVPFAPPKRRSATWVGIHRLRQPVVAAVAIGVLATSGVAAAGVATDHLPGPTRNVAYAIGLPVTSPAIETAKGIMAQLKAALAAHDVAQVQALATLLRTQLAGLSAIERASLQVTTNEQLSQADRFGQAAASGVSSGTGSSTGSGNSSNSGTSNGTEKGGATSSNGESANGTGNSSGGSPPGTSGTSEGSPGGTASGTSSPATTEPGDGSNGGTTPTTTPTTSPGTTPTTTSGATATTEPGDKGDVNGVSQYSQSTNGTSVPISPS
jgi:hypothetical protein